MDKVELIKIHPLDLAAIINRAFPVNYDEYDLRVVVINGTHYVQTVDVPQMTSEIR